ncbi:MAG: insulinase family protein [Candidatus Pacearchaeota archaeon]|nr:insulinase family protein [Candidatus Pacearchaeota archaeon]
MKNFDFKRRVLGNGMTIVFEKRDLPVVSVGFAVRCGGANESMEEKGISHFIEHMLYKGTEKRSAKKIVSEIEKNGGELNGFTSEEITAFWCKMPSDRLNIALDVLSDIVKNSKFDEHELEKERMVIFEEIKMRRDVPQIYVIDEINKYLYEKPFGPSLIGTEESMNSIDRKKIVDKFKQVYTPNNLILCVVGDANFDDIIDFAQKNFGEEKNEIPEIEIKIRNEDRIEKRHGIDQANLVFAYHVPKADDKKNYAAIVLSCLMAGGMSSRLFEEIREKRNLAYGIKGEANINKRFAYNIVYVGTTKEKMDEVKDLILKEFRKVSESLGEDELKEVKRQLIGNYHIGMEDSHDQMVGLFASEIAGDASEFYEFEKNISEVELEDVKEMAKGVLDKYSFFALVPEE